MFPPTPAEASCSLSHLEVAKSPCTLLPFMCCSYAAIGTNPESLSLYSSSSACDNTDFGFLVASYSPCAVTSPDFRAELLMPRLILLLFLVLSLQLCHHAFSFIEFGTFRSMSPHPEYLSASVSYRAAIVSFPNSLVSGNLDFVHFNGNPSLETRFIGEVTVQQDQATPRCFTSFIKDYRFELDAILWFLFVVAVSCVSFLRYSARIQLGRYASSRKTHPTVVLSLFSFILLCAACLNGVSADVSVTVNPSTGVDSSLCSTTSPCRTIAYAIQSRNATVVFLSAGTFVESSVTINGSTPFVNITGSRGSTVFDCSLSASSGPVFTIANTSIAISGITFQNCANFNVLSGVGGAVSASGSIVTVSDCTFFNNIARTGGAIGLTSGSLAVSSCLFQNNTATCPNAASTMTACSAWGGAIGTFETASVSLLGNTFSSNAVNLVLNNVISATSQAVGGGGCISVLYNLNVSRSRVTIDGNAFQNCLVQMSGFNNKSLSSQGSVLNWGIQFGNLYGGAVSLYYGLSAMASLDVHDVTSAFTNNQCQGSGIIGSVGVAGNAYGGCLSVYAGAWSVTTQGSSSIGDVSVSGMIATISGNRIVNCSAAVNSQSATYSGNIYGGGMSLVVGAYSYSSASSSSSSSSVSGSTTVGNTSYIITSNTLTSCSASSVSSGGSFGENVYGGGLLLAVGAYSYSYSSGVSSSSLVSGNTAVGNTRYTITSNTLTSCSASSVTSGGAGSNGANVYGGGISLIVEAYSYSYSSGANSRSSSNVSGSTTVGNTSYTITNNMLTSCSASSLTSGGDSGSFGANVYGGGLSLAVGAYSYSYSGGASSSSSSIVSGSTTVGNTSYIMTSNTLTSCSAASVTSAGIGSYGANVYGGGISQQDGAYSYSLGNAASSSSSSLVSGSTTVGNTSHIITSNTLTNCSASSVQSGDAGSNGANVYGGGMSLQERAYSYSYNSGASSSSIVSGSTTVGYTNYIITSNALTSCSASSVTSGGGGSNGANVYGGGISVIVGAYS